MDDERPIAFGPVIIVIGFMITGILIACCLSDDSFAGDAALILAAIARSAPYAMGVFAGIGGTALIRARIRFSYRLAMSLIPHHHGPCYPVWINRDAFDAHAPDACTGVFRRARRLGKFPLVWLERNEFHGALRGNEVISVLALLASPLRVRAED